MKHFIPYLKEVCLDPALKSIGYLLLFFIPAATGFSQSRSINTSVLTGVLLYDHSAAAFLPGITTPPASQAVCQGSTTSFTVVATGTGLTYAWQVSTNGGGTWTTITNNSQYSNATTATLTVTSITAGMNNYQYHCVVTDNVPSSVSSGPATLTVSGSSAPTVWTTNQATPICLAAGTSALGAQTSTAISYQWQLSTDGGVTWSNTVDGATYLNSLSTNGNLSITLASSLSGTLYHYIATAANGCSATSAIDTLYVLQPVIAPPATANYVPVSGNTALIGCPGSNTTLNVTATGASTLTYQWVLGAGNITNNSTYAGATTSNLTITGITTAMNGSKYKVVATDASTCSVSSGTITLTVPSVSLGGPAPLVIVCAGGSAAFTPGSTAVGGVPARQWQTDSGSTQAGGPIVWTNISPGGTNSSLSLSSVTLLMDGYHYRENITSAGGCSTTTTAESVLHVGGSGTWLGTTDTNWHVSTNWCGGVPISTTDVLVPNWAPRMPTISPATGGAVWKTIKIENTSTLRITGGTYPDALASSAYNLLGTVAYISDANQNVMPATHGSLTIGGSFNKFLQANTDVIHTFTLGGSAKLVTGNNILTMKLGSNAIAGIVPLGTIATSWIVTGNGLTGATNTGLGGLTVEQMGMGQFFPVGPTPTAYNPVVLGNSGVPDNIRVRVKDQPLPGSIFNGSINRSWLVDEQTPGGSILSLSPQWATLEEQSAYAHSTSQIIRSDGVSIVQYTAVQTVSGSNPFITAGGSFSALTQFSVASYSSLLPVRLTSFTAKRAGVFNQIDWLVDSKDQPSSYTLERSADGISFDAIDQVVAGSQASYVYTDKDPGNAVTWYRLKMLTADGKTFFYSRVVTVTNQQGTVRMELRPSVTGNGETSLFVILPQKATLRCTLTDAIGRVQLEQSIPFEKGGQSIPLNIAALAKGIYYLRVAGSDGTVKTLSLVKQ